jgi:hypothetical protein
MLSLTGTLARTICASLLLAATAFATQPDFQTNPPETEQISADSLTSFNAADFPYEDLAQSLGIPSIPDFTDGVLLTTFIPTVPIAIPTATATSVPPSAPLADVLDSFINISQIDPFASPARDN